MISRTRRCHSRMLAAEISVPTSSASRALRQPEPIQHHERWNNAQNQRVAHGPLQHCFQGLVGETRPLVGFLRLIFRFRSFPFRPFPASLGSSLLGHRSTRRITNTSPETLPKMIPTIAIHGLVKMSVSPGATATTQSEQAQGRPAQSASASQPAPGSSTPLGACWRGLIVRNGALKGMEALHSIQGHSNERVYFPFGLEPTSGRKYSV